MTRLETEKHLDQSKKPDLIMLSKHEQAINFATVHGIVTAMNGVTGSSYRGLLRLKQAFHNASAFPIDFPKMSEVEQSYGEDSGNLWLSAPYGSDIRHQLVGFEGKYSATKWGIFPTTFMANPFNLMRLSRFSVGKSPLGTRGPQGLYVAQLKEGGELVYFAVANEPGSEKLRIIESLDEQLTLALMHEVRLGAEAMKNYGPSRCDPEQIQEVLSRYPHPTSYLNPTFNDRIRL